MAKILTTRFIENPPPFTGHNRAFYNKNYIYIFTNDKKIYRYDYINNTYDLMLNISTAYYYIKSLYQYNNYVYIFFYDGASNTSTKAYAYRYNMDNNEFVTVQNNIPIGVSGYLTPFNYFYNNNTFLLSFGRSGVYSSGTTRYYLKAPSFSLSNENFGTTYKTSYVPTQNFNSIDNIYLGKYVGENMTINYNLGHITVSGNNVVFNDDLLIDSEYFRTSYDTIKIDNKLYFIGGLNASNIATNTIIIYDKDSNSLSYSDITLPFNSTNKGCEVDNSYYLFSDSGIAILEQKEYNNIYTIKNNSGDETYVELTDNTPITSIRFGFVDGIVSYRFETLTGVISGMYTPTLPERKTLIGFSTSPYSKKTTYGINRNITNLRIENSTTFYEVYDTYRPPDDTFSVILYKNSAEVNRVDKEQYLEPVDSLVGALREECSMLRPSIVYQSENVPIFNYVYIPIFNRYYFVTSLSSVNTNVWRMELNCDVLMSFKDKIRSLTGIISRQENSYNNYLIDSQIPTINEPQTSIINIASDVFTTSDTGNVHNYILTVINSID